VTPSVTAPGDTNPSDATRCLFCIQDSDQFKTTSDREMVYASVTVYIAPNIKQFCVCSGVIAPFPLAFIAHRQ